jgi:DNA-binding XRE family transcriptional regulator
MTNRLKEVRENLLICRAELARKAGVSFLTINRVEKGLPCRTETKRKILAALGFKPSQRDIVFSSITRQRKS